MHRSKFCATLLVLVLLAGCGGKGRWLEGKWVLDREYTRQQMEKKTSAKTNHGEGLGGIVKNLATGMAAPMLLGMLENAEITFTGEEIITTINGNGQAEKYEVMEAPDRDTVVIKKADGEIQTYHREDGRISTAVNGAVDLTIYLKPAE